MFKKSKRYIFFIGFLFVAMGWWWGGSSSRMYVNVYNWYAMLPPDVLRDFTHETGIRVRLDFYDNNDVLETKLFAGNSGYDIVFPSSSPYLARQIKAGAFQPLQKNLLPHLHDVDPALMKALSAVDPENVHAIPYYWGTLGIAYDEDKILSILGERAPLESYQLLFDPNIVKRLASYGVTLLEEAIDVYPLVLRYLGKDPHSSKEEDLKEAHEALLKIRPYIRRFSTSRLVGELVSGETCLAQAWSGDTQVAVQEAAKLGRKIRYVVPQEGSTLWMDAIAIPKDAPHVENAHILINFLLRPDIAARVAKFALLAPTTLASRQYLDQEMLKDPALFPSEDMMKKLSLEEEKDIHFERLRNRMWTNFRLNRP